jgi:hypothetical protein
MFSDLSVGWRSVLLVAGTQAESQEKANKA